MIATHKQSLRKNPHILRALHALRERGWHRFEIMSALRISQRTYYLCVAEIEAHRNGSGGVDA